ncbi:MAG: beta-ketoacyl-ACP synthase II [Candidatus Brocadia sp.]
MKKRVVITGMGVITPLGASITDFWGAIVEGKSGIKNITRFDVENFPIKIAGEVADFDPENFFADDKIDRMDRFSQFALAAAYQAVINSKLEIKKGMRDDMGVVLGTSIGGLSSQEKAAEDLFTRGYKSVDPMSIVKVISNAAACHIARHFGLMGPNYTISTACASGANAVGEAYKMIRDGYAQAMIAGGVDAPLTPVFFAAWHKMRVLSRQNSCPQRACKPFSKNRDGIVIGEGAGIIILEEFNSAQKRSAPIYGEIIGYGSTNDAYHLTFPHIDGEVKAIERALEDAQISQEEIDYINAHGTATALNDSVETDSIKRVFREKAYSIPISSTKSMIGHTLGASGAIEAITCALTINESIIPPTINYEEPDPQCDLDYVPNTARQANIHIALSNSFGFGGSNAVIILKKFS